MFFCVLCIFLMVQQLTVRSKSERFGEMFERKEKSPNLNYLYLSRVLTLSFPRAQFEFENRCNYYVFVNIFSPKCNCWCLRQYLLARNASRRLFKETCLFFQRQFLPCASLQIFDLFCAKPEFQFSQCEVDSCFSLQILFLQQSNMQQHPLFRAIVKFIDNILQRITVTHMAGASAI